MTAVVKSPPALHQTAPTVLAARAGDRQISLEWAANTEWDLAGYNVFQATVAEGPFTTPVNATLIPAGTTHYDATGLTIGREYFFVVQAVDKAGNLSAASNKVSATTTVPELEGYVWIKPGTFMMGSPKNEPGRNKEVETQHEVTLTEGFYLGITEVTQAEYERVMGKNPSNFTGDDSRPVEQVSWHDAMAFCDKLTTRERERGLLPEGYVFRLPTEAEWEYACRAGSVSAYCFGDDKVQLGDYAWFDKNSEGTTHPVKQKHPNAWGLYDMHGNVSEWCLDLYDKDSKQPQNRVIRGGSWSLPAEDCRSASRSQYGPGGKDNFKLGFRVACGPSDKPSE